MFKFFEHQLNEKHSVVYIQFFNNQFIKHSAWSGTNKVISVDPSFFN